MIVHLAAIKSAIITYAALLALFSLHSLVDGARMAGTWAEYAFDRQQCVRRSDFSDTSTFRSAGHLKAPKFQNMHSSKHDGCIEGNGFHPRGAQSFLYSHQNDDPVSQMIAASSLKVDLGNKPFAIEFWMRVSETHNVKKGLLFIDPTSGRACPSQFQISQEYSGHSNLYHEFTISFCNSVTKVVTSQDQYFQILKNTSDIIHMVINIGYEQVRDSRGRVNYLINLDCYFNGGKTKSSAVIGTSYLMDASGWSNDSILYFFDNPAGNPDDMTSAPSAQPTQGPSTKPSFASGGGPTVKPSSPPPSSSTSSRPTALPSAAPSSYRPPTTSFWNGTIFYFALYNRSLSADEILINWLSGLPNSMPVPISRSVVVQEDGEQGDHSNDPEFYQRKIPSEELAFISLFGADFDNNPKSPNYDAKESDKIRLQPIKLLMLSPAEESGRFYYANGSALDPESLPVVIQPEVVAVTALDGTTNASMRTGVRYRPPTGRFNLNASFGRSSSEGDESEGQTLHGMPQMATIVFTVRDQTVGLWSEGNGTIKLFVRHVDRPPVVDTASSLTLAMTHTYAPISIIGNDVDSDIVKIRVMTLPRHGDVFVRNGRSAGWVRLNASYATTAAAEIGYTFAYPIEMAYMHRSGEPELPLFQNETVIAFDSFLVALGDQEGRFSVPADLSVQVVPAIAATPKSLKVGDTNAIEDQCGRILLTGEDRSMRPRGDLKLDSVFVIKSLPQHGNLFASSTCALTSRIKVDQSIAADLDYSFAAIVYYRGRPNFFSFPNTKLDKSAIEVAPDSFGYYIETIDKSARSTVAIQYVNVRNVNTETIVTNSKWQDKIIEVSAIGAENIEVYLINGFEMSDNDKDMDVVLVEVSTQYGLITLPARIIEDIFKKYRDSLCKQMTTRFVCFAIPDPDIYNGAISISFISSPSTALTLLNSIEYRSAIANVMDRLSVTIYDGTTGQCLLPGMQSKDKIWRDVCYNSTVSIAIDVQDHSGADSIIDQSKGGSDYLLNSVNILVILIGIFVLFAIGKAIYYNLKYGQKDGSTLEQVVFSLKTALEGSRNGNSDDSAANHPSVGPTANADNNPVVIARAANKRSSSITKAKANNFDVSISGNATSNANNKNNINSNNNNSSSNSNSNKAFAPSASPSRKSKRSGGTENEAVVAVKPDDNSDNYPGGQSQRLSRKSPSIMSTRRSSTTTAAATETLGAPTVGLPTRSTRGSSPKKSSQSGSFHDSTNRGSNDIIKLNSTYASAEEASKPSATSKMAISRLGLDPPSSFSANNEDPVDATARNKAYIQRAQARIKKERGAADSPESNRDQSSHLSSFNFV